MDRSLGGELAQAIALVLLRLRGSHGHAGFLHGALRKPGHGGSWAAGVVATEELELSQGRHCDVCVVGDDR